MPQTDNVLVMISTAFNATGIKAAQAGFLGMNSALTASIAGLGLLVVASKSAIEITEKHDKAENDLAQALKVSGGNTAQAQKFLDSFIDSNRAYLSDQAEVIDGYATLTRAGLNVNEVQRDMNIALDLSALKTHDLGAAVQLVNAAEHGRLKGLVDLGITSKAYVDSSGNVVDANKNMAKVMAELEAKTAHGRDTTTQMTQATNKLSNDWQDMAKIVGPPLLGLLEGVAGGADAIVQKLNEIGHNRDWNKFISAAFGHWQDLVVGIGKGIEDIIKGIEWVIANAGKLPGAGGGGSTRYRTPIPGATGYEGMVNRPTLFMAGEAGAEHVSITPSGGGGGAGRGGNVYIDLRGAFVPDGPSIDRLANLILQRARHAPGM